MPHFTGRRRGGSFDGGLTFPAARVRRRRWSGSSDPADREDVGRNDANLPSGGCSHSAAVFRFKFPLAARILLNKAYAHGAAVELETFGETHVWRRWWWRIVAARGPAPDDARSWSARRPYAYSAGPMQHYRSHDSQLPEPDCYSRAPNGR
jgi:hypothetical protein